MCQVSRRPLRILHCQETQRLTAAERRDRGFGECVATPSLVATPGCQNCRQRPAWTSGLGWSGAAFSVMARPDEVREILVSRRNSSICTRSK
jgi:hypothetical protein